MKRKVLKASVLTILLPVLAMSMSGRMQAQDAKTGYASMASPEQYMIEKDAEIALALSAAPKSISDDAEVMMMGPHGYEVAVKGKNGFLCLVSAGYCVMPNSVSMKAYLRSDSRMRS